MNSVDSDLPLDTVAKPLELVIQQLKAKEIAYKVSVTNPVNKMFTVDTDNLYVIRQHVTTDGTYHLVAAGKMQSKERVE